MSSVLRSRHAAADEDRVIPYDAPRWLPGGHLQQKADAMPVVGRTVALPSRSEVSAAVSLEYTTTGGHVGFVSGNFPSRFEWLSRRILSFFQAE